MDLTPVLTTLFGGVLALAGGFAGQWWSERNAAAREERQREHDREVWARGLRYEAHVAFLAEFDRKYDTVRRVGDAEPGREPENDYLASLWDRHQAVRLVCTQPTALAGEVALEALHRYVFADGPWESVDYQRDRYLSAVREEFGLPEVAIMGD